MPLSLQCVSMLSSMGTLWSGEGSPATGVAWKELNLHPKPPVSL